MGKVHDDLTNGIINPETGFVSVIENGIPRFEVHKKLSILICSLRERDKQLIGLLANLTEQKVKLCNRRPPTVYFSDIEIITAVDSGELTIAAKRNDLLLRAQGDYICYVDDDDKVPDYYIEEILKAIENSPDVVGFGGHYFINGVQKNDFIHSIKYNNWFEDGKGYYRCPEHRNPVKRSLALKVGFNEAFRNFGEDKDYSMRLRLLLQTEYFIDKPMYFYYFDNKLTRAGNNKPATTIAVSVTNVSDDIVPEKPRLCGVRLSVLICSLKERRAMLYELVRNLCVQGGLRNIVFDEKDGFMKMTLPAGAEIIACIDNGEMTISDKCNVLLKRARGSYICFVDDDDSVPDYYLSEILKAINEKTPDVVSFSGEHLIDGVKQKPFIHALKYKAWSEDEDGSYRAPNHVNPVRRELALKTGFTNLTCGHDRDYSLRLRPLLSTEVFISRGPMYFYNYSSDKSKGYATNIGKIQRRNDVGYDPYSTNQQAVVYALMKTQGPVIELGSGYYSTPILHEICKGQKRLLMTFDNSPEWLIKFDHLKSDLHSIAIVEDWNKLLAGFNEGAIGVALVDQWPIEQRLLWIQKLLPVTDIIVCHDAECKIHYPQGLEGIGKYHKLFNWQSPWTMCLSDKMELL